jgi:hypothetical protein
MTAIYSVDQQDGGVSVEKADAAAANFNLDALEMLEDFQGMKMEAEKEEGEDDAEGDYSQDI